MLELCYYRTLYIHTALLPLSIIEIRIDADKRQNHVVSSAFRNLSKREIHCQPSPRPLGLSERERDAMLYTVHTALPAMRDHEWPLETTTNLMLQERILRPSIPANLPIHPSDLAGLSFRRRH